MLTGRPTYAASAARIHRLRRLGATMMAASLAGGMVLATLGPAAAQEGPGVPDGAEPVEVEKAAFYEYPYYEATPNTAVAEFPPGVFCLVAPEAPVCQPNPASDTVEGGLGGVQENEPASPESPVPPDTLPVSLVNGEKRYESAVKFELPTVPAGQEIAEFTLVLTETQPTYHSSSPAFRRAVLAALTCARECQQEEFEKALAEEPAESAVIDVEVCPLTEPFEEGRSQPAPDEQPVNCIFGATAQRIEGADGKWIVDLTFAAQAWASGELADNGVLIRPSGAPNLAYGDPDPTTQAQVTFTQELLAASTIETAAADPAPFGSDGSFGGGDDGTTGSGGFSAGNDSAFSSPSGGGGGGGGFSSDPFSAPASGGDGAVAPEVAPGAGGDADTGAGVADAPVAGPATEPAATGSTWWLWLLIPVFAVGSWLTAQSLAAEPVVASGAGARSGAMTRLIARKQSVPAPASSMTQV